MVVGNRQILDTTRSASVPAVLANYRFTMLNAAVACRIEDDVRH